MVAFSSNFNNFHPGNIQQENQILIKFLTDIHAPQKVIPNESVSRSAFFHHASPLTIQNVHLTNTCGMTRTNPDSCYICCGYSCSPEEDSLHFGALFNFLPAPPSGQTSTPGQQILQCNALWLCPGYKVMLPRIFGDIIRTNVMFWVTAHYIHTDEWSANNL